jgi:hypothetical protein
MHSLKQAIGGPHPDHSRSRMGLEELNGTDDVTMVDISCMHDLSQFSIHGGTINHFLIEQHEL